MSSSQSVTRTGYACDGCKRQKLKCSGGQPCQRCVSNGISCVYGKGVGRSSATYIKYLEEQIAQLQAQLQLSSGSGEFDVSTSQACINR